MIAELLKTFRQEGIKNVLRYIFCRGWCGGDHRRDTVQAVLVWPGLVLMIAALKMVRRNGRLDQDNQFVCINSLFSWDFFHSQAAGH